MAVTKTPRSPIAESVTQKVEGVGQKASIPVYEHAYKSGSALESLLIQLKNFYKTI